VRSRFLQPVVHLLTFFFCTRVTLPLHMCLLPGLKSPTSSSRRPTSCIGVRGEKLFWSLLQARNSWVSSVARSHRYTATFM
jgi:hypothetical protein